MALNTLSFSLSIQEASSHAEGYGPAHAPQAFLRATLTPWVDGLELSPLLFDAMAFFAQGDTPGEADLFICGCGSPGCPGLRDPVVLELGEGTVSWRLPAEPFALALNEQVQPAGGDLLLTFSAEQYVDAMQTAMGELLDLERSGDVVVAVEPYSLAEPPQEPLAMRFLDSREQVRYWSQFNESRRVLYGPLLEEELLVALLYDVTLGVSPVLIAQLCAEQRALAELGEHRDDEAVDARAHQLLTEELVPSFLQSRDNLIVAARTLKWSVVEAAAYPISELSSLGAQDEWRQLPEPVLQHAWNTVEMHLRTLPEAER